MILVISVSDNSSCSFSSVDNEMSFEVEGSYITYMHGFVRCVSWCYSFDTAETLPEHSKPRGHLTHTEQ